MDDTKKAKKLAFNFLTQYTTQKITLDRLVEIIKMQGFDIIDYDKYKNSAATEKLIDALEIRSLIEQGKAVTYKSDDIKVIFICEQLNENEKLYALAHEEGHIYCEHLKEENIEYNVYEEKEANEFAHYLLNPSLGFRINIFYRLNKRIFVALICLIVSTFIIMPCTINVFTRNKKVTYAEDKYTGNYYVTQSGIKYHREDCVYIKGRKTKILTEKMLKSDNYEPCKVCLPNEEEK